MNTINDIQTLESIYKPAVPTSLTKVASVITPLYEQWIKASRFVILSTVSKDGTDASPRGDDNAVVSIVDNKTLLLPDWKGNNRLDSLRNIVEDGRASLLFMIPDCENVVRINGSAALTADTEMREMFVKNDILPATVIVFTVGEIYFQCAKAIKRSRLWKGEGESADLAVPSAGDFLKEADQQFDGTTYDAEYDQRSKARMW